MMRFPIVRLVDEIGSYTPRFGLNEDDLAILHDGFTLGTPSLEDSEPGATGVQFGTRTVEGTLRVRGDSQTASLYLQAFARELMRSESVLMFQLDAGAEPMWLKTYLSEPGALDLSDTSIETASGETTFKLPWSLTADPFAYAPLETIDLALSTNPAPSSSAVTVVNLLTNPSFEWNASGWEVSSGGTLTRTTSALAPQGTGTRIMRVRRSVGGNITTGLSSDSRPSVTAGQPYNFSIWSRAINASTGSPASRLAMTFYNAGGSVVGTQQLGAVFTLTPTWTRRSFTATAPTGATTVRVEVLWTAPTTQAMDIDAAMLVQGSQMPATYMDGNSAGWGWAGLVNLSASGPLSSVSTTSSAYAALPQIKGDAPAPCRIEIMPSASMPQVTTLAKIAGFDQPGSDVAPVVVDLDDSGTGTGISAQVSASGYIGAGYRSTTTTPALGQWDVLARPGSYHALVAVTVPPDKAASTWAVQAFGNVASYGQAISDRGLLSWTNAAAGDRTYFVDLGIVSLPVAAGRADPDAGASVVPVALRFDRLAGSANIRVDALVLIPHDAPRIGGRTTTQKLVISNSPTPLGAGVAAIFDPDVSPGVSSWLQGDDGIRSGIPGVQGGPLTVHPGMANVLTLLPQVASQAVGTSDPTPATLTGTTSIRLSYHPRVVWLSTGL